MAQEPVTNEAGSQPLSAGETSSVGQGDAPAPTEEEQLRLELRSLRGELLSAGQAYRNLNKEIENLKKEQAQAKSMNQSMSGKLAPLTKVNGRKADYLRTWFDMIPTYLEAAGMNPESRAAVLFVAAHFEFPLTKCFIGQKLQKDNDPTGGFSTLSEL